MGASQPGERQPMLGWSGSAGGSRAARRPPSGGRSGEFGSISGASVAGPPARPPLSVVRLIRPRAWQSRPTIISLIFLFVQVALVATSCLMQTSWPKSGTARQTLLGALSVPPLQRSPHLRADGLAAPQLIGGGGGGLERRRRHLEAQNSSQESKFGGPVKGVAINWSRASKLSSPIGNKANSSAPAVGRTNAPRAATKRIKLAGSIGGGGSGGLRPISRRAAPKGPKAGQQVGANETVASKPAGQLPKATSKKIDSQLLKRLLQQTLPKANGTQPATHSGPKGAAGQFKFVFIQRATPAPSPRGSKDLGPVAGANETNDDEPVGERQTKRTDTRPAEPHSLAAAVSQKLAASLLNSAAHLAAHLSNVSSSLATTTSTWLGAAPQASRGLPEEERLKQASAANDKDNDLDSSQSSNFVDIKRKLAVNVTTPQVIKILSAGKQIIAPSQHLAARKSRPSKIYRLPLKFVANGQANGIVLHTIKQHFSMIKRIQAAGAKTSAQDPSGPNRLGQANKLKSNGSKLKGNSRLIYLPLKYLSNARPNMLQVMGTRASHKSAIVSHKH